MSDSHLVKQGGEPSLFSEKNMSDEIDKEQEIKDRVILSATPESKKESGDSGATRTGHPMKQGANEIHIIDNPPIPLQPVNPNGGASVGTSPILQEMNGLEAQPAQANEQVFEEIPVEVCGQLYQTTLEIGYSLKNKGMPMRELPETRVKTQGQIIYGILKKNQISVKHIDLFMLGAGMMGDWKYMGTLAAEQKQEDKVRGEPKENADGKYGEID